MKKEYELAKVEVIDLNIDDVVMVSSIHIEQPNDNDPGFAGEWMDI